MCLQKAIIDSKRPRPDSLASIWGDVGAIYLLAKDNPIVMIDEMIVVNSSANIIKIKEKKEGKETRIKNYIRFRNYPERDF
jgi:hypothetical protein